VLGIKLSKLILLSILYILILDIVVVVHEFLHAVASYIVGGNVVKIYLVDHYIVLTEGLTVSSNINNMYSLAIVLIFPSIVITTIMYLLLNKYPDISLFILLSELNLLLPKVGDIYNALVISLYHHMLFMFLVSFNIAMFILLGIALSTVKLLEKYPDRFMAIGISSAIILLLLLVPPIVIIIE